MIPWWMQLFSFTGVAFIAGCKLGRWTATPRKPGPRFPSRYKYQCHGCGGPLSDENVRAGRDCYWCESREGGGS